MSNIPAHIAFIMDGNGRWAKKRLLPRKLGHREGVKALSRVLDYCQNIGVKIVSIYAFSNENWSRPTDEIEALFGMVEQFVKGELQKYVEKNMKMVFMGDLSLLPESTKTACLAITEKTVNNTGLTVNIGLNYGSKQEIIRAVNLLLESGKTSVTEKEFEQNLYTAGLTSPDLIVRTSGEKRLSNFMLYQCAYSELIFTDILWPDMDEKEMVKILAEYASRDRRFGQVQG